MAVGRGPGRWRVAGLFLFSLQLLACIASSQVSSRTFAKSDNPLFGVAFSVSVGQARKGASASSVGKSGTANSGCPHLHGVGNGSCPSRGEPTRTGLCGVLSERSERRRGAAERLSPSLGGRPEGKPEGGQEGSGEEQNPLAARRPGAAMRPRPDQACDKRSASRAGRASAMACGHP